MYEITEKDINLIHKILRTYFKLYKDNQLYDDAFSIGMESLLKARNIFDESYGTKFSTLAYAIVLKDVLSFFGSRYCKESISYDKVAEEVADYSPYEVDMLEVVIGEEYLNVALEAIREEPTLNKSILLAYLRGDRYKDVCEALSISKDMYYRRVDQILDRIREKCLVNQSN